MTMVGHYLTVSVRNLGKTPIAAIVNVLTLALGLVCFIGAYAVVRHWAMADGQFDKAGRTFVITTSLEFNDGEIRSGVMPYTTEHFAKYLETDFPQLESVVRVYGFPDVSVSTEDRGLRVYRMIVDSTFFELFDLPFVAGSPDEALAQPRSVVLTRETALQLFGDANPIGRTVTLANQIDTTVTGIVDTIPASSHLARADIFTSWDIRRALQLARNPDAPEPPENWFGGYICTTYVVLPEDGSLTEAGLLQGLAGFPARRVSAEELGSSRFDVGAIPLSGLSVAALNSTLFGGASGSVSITTLLLLLGGLVLGVACINYASLATARAITRARDVGLRKVVGATRLQIAGQYLFESGLLVGAGVVVAAFLVTLVAPLLSAAADVDIRPTVLSSGEFYVFLGLLVMAVTLVAGLYPAAVLSGASPLDALRLGRSRAGPKRLSKWLVGVQFLVASFLLIAVIVMYAQNIELRRTGLGLSSDPLLVIDNASALSGVDNETLRTELLRLPQVTAVTEAASVPWTPGISLWTLSPSAETSASGRSVFVNLVGYDFFSVFGLETVAGRVFDREHDDMMADWDGRTADRPFHVVIDRELASELGFATPAAAIEQILYLPRNPGLGREVAQPLRIIGVVEARPMHLQGAGATSNLFLLGQNFETQVVRLSAADVSGGLEAIDAMWRRISPAMPRSYQFVDEIFERSYATFGKVNGAFATLAGVALFISMIGLLGMAVQIANRRVHEIGVRKTLGASTGQVVRMLLLDIGKPVLIANLIAWPLGYLAAQVYLSIFMHRIVVTPAPFLLTLLFTVLIAVLAVGGQALRAARVRPAEVLNRE